MLHGLAGTGDEFTATAEALGGPNRFILPDLRGHGASTRRPADLSRAAFTGDVAALIRHVSPGRPVALAGQSMGGHTAVLAAAACPNLVERLVVLEATIAGTTDLARIGNYFRSWPLPFASAAAALEFLGSRNINLVTAITQANARSPLTPDQPARGGRVRSRWDWPVLTRAGQSAGGHGRYLGVPCSVQAKVAKFRVGLRVRLRRPTPCGASC
jgi:pimeloyl-ACP methyl ester carboxylesterase